MALHTFSCFIIYTWAMAILAILLLGVGTFGLIAGIASGGVAVIIGSVVLLLAGGVLGVRCLIKEGVLRKSGKSF
jgi:hypothetical protein